MNPDRLQSIPSEPASAVTVLDVHGDPLAIHVEKYGEDHGALAVRIRQDENDTGLTLWPMEATRLAQVLLEAADAAGDRAARRILRVLEEYVARKQVEVSEDLLDDDEEDISPEDRIKAAEGMERLVADMRAAGAATVGELFAMQQEAANKANADGPR